MRKKKLLTVISPKVFRDFDLIPKLRARPKYQLSSGLIAAPATKHWLNSGAHITMTGLGTDHVNGVGQ